MRLVEFSLQLRGGGPAQVLTELALISEGFGFCRRKNSCFRRQASQFGDGVQAKLPSNGGAVQFDGAFVYREVSSNLLVKFAANNVAQHFKFSFAKQRK